MTRRRAHQPAPVLEQPAPGLDAAAWIALLARRAEASIPPGWPHPGRWRTATPDSPQDPRQSARTAALRAGNFRETPLI